MARERFQPGEYGNISARQLKPGIWEAKTRWCDPRTGATVAVTKRGATRTSAVRNLKTKLDGSDRTHGDPDRIGGNDTVEKLATLWFRRKTAEGKANPESLSKYESALRLHVNPRLGAYQVRALSIGAVDSFLIDTIETAPAQAKRSRLALTGMLRLAAAHGTAPVNFMRETVTVPNKPRPIRILTLSEIDRMLGAVDAYRNEPGRRGPRPVPRLGQLLRVMLGGGLRIGEALALRKRDVTTPVVPGAPWLVTIEGTIVTPDNGPTYRKPEPKTSSSRRTLPVAGFAGVVLEQLVNATQDAGPDWLLFTTRNGTPIAPGNMRRTWRAIRSQGMLEDLEDVTPHALHRGALRPPCPIPQHRRRHRRKRSRAPHPESAHRPKWRVTGELPNNPANLEGP
jgi:integrase